MIGQTTRILEEAISLLAELPEDHFVFITGSHRRWLFELEQMFQETGLVGVKFVPPERLMNGYLSGYMGLLLVDAPEDLSYREMAIIREEQIMLKERSRWVMFDY